VTDLVELKKNQREDILGMPIAPSPKQPGGHVQPRGQTTTMAHVDESPSVAAPTVPAASTAKADDTSWDAF
jgi:hypothetical protein